MIPAAITFALITFIFWLAKTHERRIRILAKRYEPKIRLSHAEQKIVISACDMVMELHPDPQSDEYRTAVGLKLRLERNLRN